MFVNKYTTTTTTNHTKYNKGNSQDTKTKDKVRQSSLPVKKTINGSGTIFVGSQHLEAKTWHGTSTAGCKFIMIFSV